MPTDEFSIAEHLQDFLTGRLQVSEFTSTFETWWNFHADKTSFEPAARAALIRLFDIVALYTPFDEDRTSYPGYTTAADVLDAATLAGVLLGQA